MLLVRRSVQRRRFGACASNAQAQFRERPIEMFVVTIYRRQESASAPDILVGTVEVVESGRRFGFRSASELLRLLRKLPSARRDVTLAKGRS